MAKPTDNLPTVEDLTRDGLLRLIRIIHPRPVEAKDILTVMADQAWRAYEAAKKDQEPAWQERTEAFDRCYGQKPRGSYKAKLAYLDADAAVKRIDGRAEAAWRRWHRLSDQLVALLKKEAQSFPGDEF